MDSLRQQVKLMNLPPEQEQAIIKQYDDAFQLQEQQLSQQAELYNNNKIAGTGQMRTIWVRTSHTSHPSHPSHESDGFLFHIFNPDVDVDDDD